MNIDKMQMILDWMQYLDPNGEWGYVDDYYLADCGLTWEDVPGIIRQALTQWLENGMSETAYRTMMRRLEEATK